MHSWIVEDVLFSLVMNFVFSFVNRVQIKPEAQQTHLRLSITRQWRKLVPLAAWLLLILAHPATQQWSVSADTSTAENHLVHQWQWWAARAHGSLQPRHHVHRPACGHARGHPANRSQIRSSGEGPSAVTCLACRPALKHAERARCVGHKGSSMAGCQGRAAYWQSHVTPAGCSVAKIRHRH